MNMERILPAYPLWIIDPMFSVWTPSDILNEGETMLWTGKTRDTYGFVRYNGKTYSFLGKKEGSIPLEQTDLKITTFSTDYAFRCPEFVLKISFVSPLPPDDLEVLSCPVCYTEYELIPNGACAQDFNISLAISQNYCYDKTAAPVSGGVIPMNGYETAYMSRRRELPMSHADDVIAPDWGCTYLAGEEAWFVTSSAIENYIKTGMREYIFDQKESGYIMAVNQCRKGYFMTGFDDKISVFYFGEWLKTYFFKDGRTILDALTFSRENHDAILQKLQDFDKKFADDCRDIGKDYYLLACAAFRQSVGAHKLVENSKGEILFLSKECNSNGCIGTADITYPSAPLYLIYNPELVKGMLRGIFDFARMPVWPFDFAPHDIGTYPYCCGQIYGIKRKDDKYSFTKTAGDVSETYTPPMLYMRPAGEDVYNFDMQMPVEESGNMIIMTAAACVACNDFYFAEQNYDLLHKWVVYLEKYGLVPENQLCTDDFAGHLANNVNLAIKAIVGIRCFAHIAEALNHAEESEKYQKIAFTYAQKLKEMVDGDVMPLAYGQNGTFSMKYNLLFDKLFGFGLFEKEIWEREADYYIKEANRYGVPLDTRKDYTKSDWILWCAALTDEREKAESLYAPVIKFLKETPTRLPFGDWYDTKSGKYIHFYNRTVQGGILAPLLKKSEKLKI